MGACGRGVSATGYKAGGRIPACRAAVLSRERWLGLHTHSPAPVHALGLGLGRPVPRQFVGQCSAQDEDGAAGFGQAEGLVQEEGG